MRLGQVGPYSQAVAAGTRPEPVVNLEPPLIELTQNLTALGVRGFTDSPFNYGDAFKQLRRQYPDAVFLLGVRDTAAWEASYCKYLKTLFNTTGFDGLLPWVRELIVTGYNGGSRQRALDGWRNGCRGWGRAVTERNAEVVRYFMCGNEASCVHGNASYVPALYAAASDAKSTPATSDARPGLGGLLVYELETMGWQPLCSLLGVDEPSSAFPASNRGSQARPAPL